MFTGNFEADYGALEKAIGAGTPFAFSRFGDGEWYLLNRKPYRSADAWASKGETPIHDALFESLCADLPGYHVGYSPPCCHPKCVGYYAEHIRVPQERRTYATVLFHGNFLRAQAFFSKLPAFTIGSSVHHDLRISSDLVSAPFDTDAILHRMLEIRDRPILIAAGPAACILVYRYWRWTASAPEKRVTCIDIGSLLDEKTHGQATRYYHDVKNPMRQHRCRWDNWEPARQRVVVGVHNATRGTFVRDVRAPNAMPSPLETIAKRRSSGAQPKWMSTHLKKSKK